MVDVNRKRRSMNTQDFSRYRIKQYHEVLVVVQLEESTKHKCTTFLAFKSFPLTGAAELTNNTIAEMPTDPFKGENEAILKKWKNSPIYNGIATLIKSNIPF